MPKNNSYIYSPSDYVVSTSIVGTTMPTVLATSSTVLNLPVGWYDLGLLSDAGASEAHNFNENKIYDMAGSLVAVFRNQEERPWTFECLQDDAISAGLRFPGTSVATTGATAEVQTITSTATAGSFRVLLDGLPATPAQTWNVATATLQASLIATWDLAVTVTGTAGTSYIITFPTSYGNAPPATLDTSLLTGGTASIATTTPGVTGVNTRSVGSGLVRNLRQWCIDLFYGTTTERYLMSSGEAIWTGTITMAGSGPKISQFTMNPFKDGNNNYYQRLDNSPAQGLSFA